MFTQLKPLSKGLNILQKDFVTIADSYNIWMTLLNRHLNLIINLLKKESGFKAIPLFRIPYMHPVYKKENLTTEQAETVHN